MIKLKKPLAFFDLETTGIDLSNDRVIEIYITKIEVVDGNPNVLSKTNLHHLINPGRLIPNADLHGITDEMVKGKPYFRDVAEEILEFIKGCDLGGYNIKRFDIALLSEELFRCGLSLDMEGVNVVDVYNLYRLLNSHKLTAAYKKYTGTELNDAHRAKGDVDATIEVLYAMAYEKQIPTDIDELLKFQNEGKEYDDQVDFAGKFVRNAEGVILLNFGKHKGNPANDHQDFLWWMKGKDFTFDTLSWVDKLLSQN